MLKKQSALYVLILITICFISRVPQLVSPNLVLDGDECILALMAKHQFTGKDIVFFSYGQQYGFSLIESSVIALYYALFHAGDIAVKLAMLTMWVSGTVFLYKALVNINTGGKWQPLFIILLFVLCPSMAVWSMKAWAGYLTSFLLSTIAIFLLFHKTMASKNITWLLISMILVIIFKSQPLFLPGLLPFLVYAFYKNFSFKKIGFAIAGIIPPALFFLSLKKHSGYTHTAAPFDFSWSALSNITKQPSFLFTHLNGYYFLTADFEPSIYATIYSVGIICIIVLIFAAALILGIR